MESRAKHRAQILLLRYGRGGGGGLWGELQLLSCPPPCQTPPSPKSMCIYATVDSVGLLSYCTVQFLACMGECCDLILRVYNHFCGLVGCWKVSHNKTCNKNCNVVVNHHHYEPAMLKGRSGVENGTAL